MTLQRQTISVPLGSGQSDEATRPLVDGNETSQNFTFPKTGQAQKRPPPLVMSTAGLSTAALNSVVDVGGIPAILDALGSASYDPNLNMWVRANRTAPVQSTALVDPLIRVGSYCVSSCIAILGDIMCCAWVDGRTNYTDPAPMVAFFSIANGTVAMVSPPARVAGAVGAVRLATIDSGDSNARIVMFTSGLKVASWLPTSGAYTFGSFATPSGTFISGSVFDVVSDSSAAYACQRCNAAVDEVASILVKVEANGTITQKLVPYLVESMHLDTVGARLIGIGLDVSGGASIDQPGNVMVATCDFGAGWSVGNWTQVVKIGRHKAVGRFNATDFAIVHSRVGITNNDSTNTMAWGVKVEIRGPSGLTLATGHIESATVCSPPTYIPETGACVMLLADNNGPSSNLDLGPNLYLAALTVTDGVLHARKVAHASQSALINHLAASGQSGPTYDEFGSYGTRLARDSDGVIYFPVQVETGIPGLSTSEPVVDLARVNIVNPPPLRAVNVAGVVVAASGFGVESVEATYCATMCLAPTMAFRIADIIQMTGPGLGTLPGTATVSLWFGWVWIDMQGNEHRAAPSVAYTGSVSNFYVVDGSLVTPKMIQLPLPVCRETRLEERGVELYFDVWSGGEDAVPGYRGRFLARTSPGYPDCVVCHLNAGSGTVTLANATDLGTIGGGGALAWWQSELEPNPPPASLDLVSWQSRIWALSAVRRNTIIASKPIQRGFAPEFAAELEVTIPDAGGDCVALAALDDKVVVFKERNIYVVSGDPGDSLGNNSTLQQPRLVSGDVGCICAQSVVEGPFGVAFQSQRGFYTLSRGLELSFVGDKVQALTEDDGTLRFCGALSPRESIVRWTAARSSWAAVWEPLDYGLAWDFIRGQWSHWTDYDARHHAVVDGVMHRVSATQVIKEPLPGDYTTSESLVALKSPWLKLNGLAGFQRVWRLSVVLKHYTGHLKAEIFYDYATESFENVTWLEPEIVALRGSQNIVTLSMRPAQQKCQAIQVQFSEFITFPGDPFPGEENPPAATVGRGFEPISVDLEVGTKSGTYRRALSATAKR